MIRFPNSLTSVESPKRSRANTGAWMLLGIVLIFAAIGMLRQLG